MIQAFKSVEGILCPFMSVLLARKISTFRIQLDLLDSKECLLYFKSEEDRDQQFANFEKWLTIKTNSI